MGVSTSSHQVEGNNLNNWTEWEKQNANKLAQKAKSRYAYLENNPFIKEQTNPLNYLSRYATNHYENAVSDLDLIKDLGLNSYRFSIEWSRIEPEKGRFNMKELNFYKNLLVECKKRKITPFLTLWHWTEPLWVEAEEGITSKNFPDYFENFTKKVVGHLKGDVDFIITINEPTVISGMSFLTGEWPPSKRNVKKYRLALNNLAKAHKKSYKAIKEIDGSINVGIAHHIVALETNFLLLKPVIFALDYLQNKRFLRKVRGFEDFIGVNHYFKNLQYNKRIKSKEIKKSDLGWNLDPDSIYSVLKSLKRYNLPIYITESGLADKFDNYRSWYIEENVKAIEKALKEGIDVRGYFHWSLLDNFEWSHGFWPRFGLFEVDYKTFKRIPRKSAYFYKRIVENKR